MGETLDQLNEQVTNAILAAEEHDRKGRRLWQEVARLEAAIAAHPAASSLERYIGEFGANEARRKARMTVEQIRCCQRIGRNEAENTTIIGLPELDALCDTAIDLNMENERLRLRFDRALAQTRRRIEYHTEETKAPHLDACGKSYHEGAARELGVLLKDLFSDPEKDADLEQWNLSLVLQSGVFDKISKGIRFETGVKDTGAWELVFSRAGVVVRVLLDGSAITISGIPYKLNAAIDRVTQLLLGEFNDFDRSRLEKIGYVEPYLANSRDMAVRLLQIWGDRSPEPEHNRDVHTEHCCELDGCKYGDDACPVMTRRKVQSNTCEYCDL